eukprot:882758-Alexandrium_andersonii.AAC.1
MAGQACAGSSSTRAGPRAAVALPSAGAGARTAAAALRAVGTWCSALAPSLWGRPPGWAAGSAWRDTSAQRSVRATSRMRSRNFAGHQRARAVRRRQR